MAGVGRSVRTVNLWNFVNKACSVDINIKNQNVNIKNSS